MKEERKVENIYEGTKEHGKSTEILECPFCKKNTEVYIWSRRGSGKKCECGAKFESGIRYTSTKEVK